MMVPFRKMNGLGNDFVILDARSGPLCIDPVVIAAIADRRTGIGFDQMITLEPGRGGGVPFMRIHNADGSEAEACGNASRCIAHLLMLESGLDRVAFDTAGGPLTAWCAAGQEDAGASESRAADTSRISVDMGRPRFGWADIPLARPVDDVLAVTVPSAPGALGRGACVNVGNPHVVFFPEGGLAAVHPSQVGPAIEADPMFPARVNVSFAAMRQDGGIDLTVWERGAGLTRACGTAACATAAVAWATGRAEGPVEVHLPGGSLTISPGEGGTLVMTGAIADEFSGELDPGTGAWRRAGAFAEER